MLSIIVNFLHFQSKTQAICRELIAQLFKLEGYIFSLLPFPHNPMTEGILRLGLNHFHSKAECGEAGRESVAAEGRWVGPEPINAVLPFRRQMPQTCLNLLVIGWKTSYRIIFLQKQIWQIRITLV